MRGWHANRRHDGSPMNRMRCYLRARLHRRIFLYLSVSILLSILAASLVGSLVLGNTSYPRELEQGQLFIGRRFEAVWNEHAARDRLAEEMHQLFEVDVAVRAPNNDVLEARGAECLSPNMTIPVMRDGKEIGAVWICSNRYQKKALGIVSALGAVVFVLGVLSNIAARKAVQPLTELTRAASDIGVGKFDTEIQISPHAPDEFLVLRDALTDMAKRIKQQKRDQRELLASVSHELRSPLARLRLLLELSHDESGIGSKLHNDMEREMIEIDDLVGELLASSRVDFSALSRRPFDLVELAERTIERSPNKVPITIHGEPRMYEGDATLISRALTNLLDNANAHGGGAEAVTLRFGEETVQIQVNDKGPGFQLGEEVRVFQAFYRRPSSTHDSLGLGLSLVQRIAEAHGGRASAENRASGGAVVTIELPLRADES